MWTLVLALVALMGRVGLTAGHRRRIPPGSCAGNQWEAPTNLEGKLKSSEFTWIRLMLSCHRVPTGHALRLV